MQAGLRLSGRYALRALLGRGGMGEVWRGIDEHLDRPVAVKVLREHLADPELAGRFRREARLSARLQHPGITVVHDVGSDGGVLFIVMELLHGRDLASMLAGAPAGLPIDAVVSLIIQTAEALQAAHAGYVVHRDLKPANLFVLDSGQLKICDFGIAWAIDSTARLTATGQAIGTPAYMSPEQCRGQQVDERSDLYSLGCVLYEMLTGQPPFAAGHPLAIMAQHLDASPAAPHTIRPDIPSELDHLALELLAKDPACRPADASYITAALQTLRYTPTVRAEAAGKASFQPGLSAPAAAGSTGSRPIGPDETVSAALASSSVTSSAQPAAITRVPRTEAERQQVLLQRPHYWEFLYFAGQLLHERSTVEAKYRGRMVHSSMENRESAAGGKDGNPIAQFSDFKQLVDYIFQQFSEALDLVRKMSEVINDEAALERAFGARGEEGYPDRLAHLARHWNGTYEALLAWASSLRGANVPPEYQKLLELAARYADEPIQKYRMLIDDYATQVDGMYDAVPMAMATGKPISIEARLSLSSPDKVINDYVAELNSLRSRLHLEGRL